MRVLVAGGAGYIGSVVTAALLADGHEVTVLDDLSTGHADAVPAGATLAEVSLHESAPVLADVRPEAVLHFAAKSLVGISQQQPEDYWHTNVGGSLALLEAMRARRLPPDRVLLDRGDLRRAGQRADPGGRPHPADEHLRRLEARRRPHADLLRGGPRVRGGEPALLQRRGRGVRPRRAARHRDPPHPARAAGRGRAARVADRLRRGLPDPRRHLHPRLRARRGPRRRAPAGVAGPRVGRAPHLQPGQRHRLLGAGGRRRRARGDRPSGAGRRRCAPRRRPGAAGGLQRPDPRRPRRGRRSTPTWPGSCATPGTSARTASWRWRRSRRPRWVAARGARRPAGGRSVVRPARSP